MKIDRKERVLLELLKECAGEEKGIIKKSALPRLKRALFIISVQVLR